MICIKFVINLYIILKAKRAVTIILRFFLVGFQERSSMEMIFIVGRKMLPIDLNENAPNGSAQGEIRAKTNAIHWFPEHPLFPGSKKDPRGRHWKTFGNAP